jgi:GT2 family glycosyltransferase
MAKLIRPILSIIIPSWNTSQITLNCLKSIIKYLPPASTEIIVVDNASSDDTVSKIKRLKSVPWRIKIKVNSRNLGYSIACNQGASLSSGDYFLFLNSDTEFVDATIFNLINFLARRPSLGVVGPQLLNLDFTPQGSVFPPQTPINAFREFILGRKSYSKYFPKSLRPSAVWALSGTAILVSRPFFNQLGGWNEKYFMYFEDMDFCRRVRQQNKFIYYYPLCRLLHHHGASGRSLGSSQYQWYRLIRGSITYHGYFRHYLLNLIIWLGQKLRCR